MTMPKNPEPLDPIETETVGEAAPAMPGGDRPERPSAAAHEVARGEDRADDVADPSDGREDGASDHAAPDEGHPDHAGRSFAATALLVLVGALAVSGVTLWAAPKIAPHVPAAVGKYLLPGRADVDARLAALEQALTEAGTRAAAESAALSGQVADLSQRVAAAEAAGAGAAATAGAEALAVAEAASAAASALADRLAAVEAEIAALRAEQVAVSTALSQAAAGGAAGSPELAAAVAALGERVENLAARVEQGPSAPDIEDRIAALAQRVEAAEAAAAAARSAQSQTLGEVSSVIRTASLRSAIAALSGRVAGGGSYAEQLSDVASLAGRPAPEALADRAETGLATAASLSATFPAAAQAAVHADIQARAGSGTGAQVLGWLRAQVTGRPTSEQEGDSVGAITSRIGARLEDGDLGRALAEAETLPEHSRAAMGDWLDRLRGAVTARAALENWLAEIDAGG